MTLKVGGADPERKVRMTAPTHSSLCKDAPLLDLIDRQVELCLELEGQSAALLEQLRSGECDEAAVLIGQRQPLIDELSALNADFTARCPSWAAYVATLPTSQQRRALTAAGRLDDLLKRVRTMDDLLKARLAEAKGEISHSLAELVKGKHSNRAYVTGTTSASAPGKNRFMDERG